MMDGFVKIILPHPTGTRIPKDENDFGDCLTIGLHLKRRGKNITDANVLQDFGVYAGYVPDPAGGYKVGIKNLAGCICSYLTYNTLELLKEEWMLD